MRWLVLFHLWLSALLSVQQPSVLVRAERGGPVPAQAAARESSSAPGDGDEDELPAVRSGSEWRVRALPALAREPSDPWRWVQVEHEPERLTPRRCDTARGHWRAAQLPPPSPPDEEPPARA